MSTNFRAKRFNYRSGGRGGESSPDQSSRPNQFVDNQDKKATAMLLFHPQTREGGYATYATVYEEIISHVEQTYGKDSENILKSIEQNAYLTFPEPTPTMIPVPSPANAGDPITDIQKLEYDTQLRMETVKYQTKMEMWLKETKSYSMAMRKFASDILKNYCSWTMEQRVVIHPRLHVLRPFVED